MARFKTTRGYDFFEVSSALQKAIRRGDAKMAGYFALELFHSGYWKYVWKRLMTYSAEDCAGIISQEIKSLYDGFLLVNEGRKKKDKGRIFISKAVIILAQAAKSRDADHLQNFVYDNKMGITDEEIEQFLSEVDASEYEIPDFAFDVHTRRGRRMGKTKRDFFIEEHEALQPRQKGLFDDLVAEL